MNIRDIFITLRYKISMVALWMVQFLVHRLAEKEKNHTASSFHRRNDT